MLGVGCGVSEVPVEETYRTGVVCDGLQQARERGAISDAAVVFERRGANRHAAVQLETLASVHQRQGRRRSAPIAPGRVRRLPDRRERPTHPKLATLGEHLGEHCNNNWFAWYTNE